MRGIHILAGMQIVIRNEDLRYGQTAFWVRVTPRVSVFTNRNVLIYHFYHDVLPWFRSDVIGASYLRQG